MYVCSCDLFFLTFFPKCRRVNANPGGGERGEKENKKGEKRTKKKCCQKSLYIPHKEKKKKKKNNNNNNKNKNKSKSERSTKKRMTRYYCEYCDAYLTHDSATVRRQHISGFKHKANVRNYYLQFTNFQQNAQNMPPPMAMPGMMGGGQQMPGMMMPPPMMMGQQQQPPQQPPQMMMPPPKY